MALTISQFQTPVPPTLASINSTHQRLYLTQKPVIFYRRSPKFTQFAPESLKFTTIPRASQEEENTTTNEKSIPDPSAEGQPEKSKTGEITDLGREIKPAMKEREGQKGETGFLDGVAEEIREIEWSAFNKVLGTTRVVLGVIAGCLLLMPFWLSFRAVFLQEGLHKLHLKEVNNVCTTSVPNPNCWIRKASSKCRRIEKLKNKTNSLP